VLTKRLLGAILGGLLLDASALAQDGYPTRPIQTVIGFPAGSGADTMCRFFTNKAQELAGQPIVIVNKPGAFSSIAYATVAAARPDGYTMLLAGNSLMAAGEVFVKNLPFTTASFVPVTTIAETPFIVTVSAKSTIKSVKELIAHLQSKSRNRYGHYNPANFVASAYLKQLAGFEAEPVPYKGAADAIVDLENGTLDFLIFDGTFAIGHIKSGRLRPVAVTSKYRLNVMPDVPTMIEEGYSDFEMNPWWAAYFPAGTSETIVGKAAGWVSTVAKAPETAKTLEPLVLVPVSITAAQIKERLAADSAMWRRLSKLAGFEAQ